MKIAKNARYGGFYLSDMALAHLSKVTGMDAGKCFAHYLRRENRNAPELIQVIEELGDKASFHGAKLVVVDVPDDVEWYVSEDDGWEVILEKGKKRKESRSW